MGDVLFYRLSESPLEKTLPDLLTRTLDRGWRAVVRAGDAAALPWLDDLLWSFDPASFLPHDVAGHGAEETPILLTTGKERPEGDAVLFLVAGARVDAAEADAYTRLCLLFSKENPAALEAARADWRAVRDHGASGKFWAEENGRWVEKATT